MGARRRIKETLSKIARVRAYHMALTLPEECWDVAPAVVHSSFQKLGTLFTASTLWRLVGLLYKREFTKKGALHYHIVIFGLKDDTAARELQRWITRRWVRMICRGLPADSPVRAKMTNVHMHRKNMEPVRKSIASYFAKYLGKDPNAPQIHVPGKWWGMLNVRAIPFVAEKTLQLPSFVRDRARRMASALQSKRIQHALYVSAMRNANLMIHDKDGNLVPGMSLQQFHQARNFQPSFFTAETPRSDLLWCHYEMRKRLLAAGYRPGTHNRPRPSSFGTITLVGYDVPALAERIIRHAATMWREHLTTHPF